MKKIIPLILIAHIGFLGYSTANNLENTLAVDTTETVSISNSNQVIRIKGNNNQNPLLLYLNGAQAILYSVKWTKCLVSFKKIL